MPAMHFRVQWPDESTRDCYSPSTIVRDYLEVGASYPLPEFMDRSRAALNAASERVREKYGFACSSAMDELQTLERLAAGYAATDSASSASAASDTLTAEATFTASPRVTVLAFDS